MQPEILAVTTLKVLSTGTLAAASNPLKVLNSYPEITTKCPPVGSAFSWGALGFPGGGASGAGAFSFQP